MFSFCWYQFRWYSCCQSAQPADGDGTLSCFFPQEKEVSLPRQTGICWGGLHFFWILLEGKNLATHWTRQEATAATSLFYQKDYGCGYHHLPTKTSEHTVYNRQIFPYSRSALHRLRNGSEPNISTVWNIIWKDEFDLLLFSHSVTESFSSSIPPTFFTISCSTRSHFPKVYFFCLLSLKCILDHHLWLQNKRTGELISTDSFPNGTYDSDPSHLTFTLQKSVDRKRHLGQVITSISSQSYSGGLRSSPWDLRQLPT